MSTTKVLELLPDQLRVVPGLNIRTDMGDIKSLAASISNHGMRTAMKVRKTKDVVEIGDQTYPVYDIIEGHRRKKALDMANKTSESWIMAKAEEVGKGYSDLDALNEMMATGDGALRLSVLEFAEGCRRLRDDHKLKPSEIARQHGKTQTHIEDCLLLADKATKAIKSQIKDGTLSASAAIEMLKTADAEEVEENVGKAAEAAKVTGKKKITTKDVEKAVGKPVTKKSSAKAATRKAADERPAKAEKPGKSSYKAADELIGLKEAIQSQEDMVVNRDTMKVIDALIAILSGRKQAVEYVNLFYENPQPEEVEDQEEEEAAPVKKSSKKPAAAPAKKAAKGIAKAAASGEYEDEDDEDFDADAFQDEEDDEI